VTLVALETKNVIAWPDGDVGPSPSPQALIMIKSRSQKRFITTPLP
jgi:hypothetical protein